MFNGPSCGCADRDDPERCGERAMCGKERGGSWRKEWNHHRIRSGEHCLRG